RVAANARRRLLAMDEAALLEPFRARLQPSAAQSAWAGEHAGKWIDAASLAWLNSGDPALRAELARVVSGRVGAQEAMGYLGTYPPDRRFGLYEGAEWDAWVHKYDLVGLLSFWRATGDAHALPAARRVADLLFGLFGPGRRSILTA